VTTTYTREDLSAIDDEPVVLDLGCGSSSTGIGVDINYEADITADLNEGIPVESQTVDVIILEHVLEHLEHPIGMLREIHRVLRAGGEAHIEVPNAGWLPVRLYLTRDIHRFWEHKHPDKRGHWLARRLGTDDPDRTPHLSLWSKRLLASHLDRVGFNYEFINSRHWSRNIRVKAWP